MVLNLFLNKQAILPCETGYSALNFAVLIAEKCSEILYYAIYDICVNKYFNFIAFYEVSFSKASLEHLKSNTYDK